MVDHAIIVALYAFMIYIGLITYWIFIKFDRYERVAIDVIKRVVDSGPTDNNSYIREISVKRPSKALLHHTNPVINTEISFLIKRIAEKLPPVVQKNVDELLDKWYTKMCIELFARCVLSKIPKNI